MTPAHGPQGSRPRHLLALTALLFTLAVGACSPLYVMRAAVAEARILAGRRPLAEVVADPATDARTRGKLLLAMEARAFARDSLGLDVGRSYTSYTHLRSDTLALVLSAAYPDRLQMVTWWFPIVGHVPYRGFFSESQALREEERLRERGLDTYLRPTSAFSTLGWFADPILSSMMRADEVDLVETLLHEMAHSHLFVSGHVRFNESFATWVGRVGAAEFFCRRAGGGPDTVWCERAQARWRDFLRFSGYLDALVPALEAVYSDASLSSEQKLAGREEVAALHRRRFLEETRPLMESYTTWGFVEQPLNHATLLSQMLYYHRLADFQAYLEAYGGSLAGALGALTGAVRLSADPFEVLGRR